MKARVWSEGASATSLTDRTWKADPKVECGSIQGKDVPKRSKKTKKGNLFP